MTAPCNAVDLHEQAHAALAAGRLDEAYAAAAASLAAFEAEDGPDTPDAANVSNLLASIAEARGRYADAARHARHAWQILETLGTRFTGPDADAILVESLSRVGAALRAMGRYQDAEPWLKQAVARAETPATLNNLAVLYKYTGSFDEAESLYRRALSLVPEDGLDAATIYHNLGGLRHARGHFAEGEPYARRAVEIRTAILGPDHPETLADACAHAGLLDGLERYAESEPIYRHALDAWRRIHGPEHYEIAVTLNNLAALQPDPAEAESLYRQSLEMKRRLLGPDHPDTALTELNLASLTADAPLAHHALQVFESTLTAPHPKLEAARDLCARLGVLCGLASLR